MPISNFFEYYTNSTLEGCYHNINSMKVCGKIVEVKRHVVGLADLIEERIKTRECNLRYEPLVNSIMQ